MQENGNNCKSLTLAKKKAKLRKTSIKILHGFSYMWNLDLKVYIFCACLYVDAHVCWHVSREMGKRDHRGKEEIMRGKEEILKRKKRG